MLLRRSISATLHFLSHSLLSSFSQFNPNVGRQIVHRLLLSPVDDAHLLVHPFVFDRVYQTSLFPSASYLVLPILRITISQLLIPGFRCRLGLRPKPSVAFLLGFPSINPHSHQLDSVHVKAKLAVCLNVVRSHRARLFCIVDLFS
ncbi:unnamed protein product [Protopolystoma xenopodis]|uniref:Uncharacterized protein n=1 Tax=Protopolystoma xenopodis TaxID=117903 RepID=A0A448WRY0_9PLAT|nr:unnamed protein product [Protopolystoma xenopodis]